jgi:hypothetical protein
MSRSSIATLVVLLLALVAVAAVFGGSPWGPN